MDTQHRTNKQNIAEAELAVRWCLQRGHVAIPKSKSAQRLEVDTI